MRITDNIDLFYPDGEAKQKAAVRRRSVRESGAGFTEDLQLDNIKRLITLTGSERFMALAQELSCDIETIEYRLDCLEDFLNNPDLAQTFRKIISELSGRRPDMDEEADDNIDSFYDIKDKMDELSFFLGSIEEINKIYKRIGLSVKSAAMKGLFQFFGSLDQKEEFITISRSLSELNETFSKTIRSVKIGINFTTEMIPDSAGLLEVSYDKIYPKGNILERMVFKTFAGKEQFSGEEHLNSITHKTPVDIDTALFRELSDYTRDYAKRIAAALRSYRVSFFTDISELEQQLDYYEGAAAFIKSVQARGLPMCRPKILPKESRSMKLCGAFDLNFYKQLVAEDAAAVLADRIVTNDIELCDKAGFYMVTGANNGGKTTFARAVGLCQVMAQVGMYVPAEYAEIAVCDNIFTHFPRDEQVGIDTSRFTTEIKDLKAIVCGMTKYSMVILNESLQSTTPEECLKIAEIHMEIMAAAGVRGLYVTHLTGLYRTLEEINAKDYPTKIGSLVSAAGEDEKRLYKIIQQPPSGESLAFSIYRQFGATFEDIRNGDEDEQA
ncbi:MAG: hypothetical protein ACI4JW_07025 [Oscillospiraceae bacterium]